MSRSWWPSLAVFGLVVAFGATPGCNCSHNPVAKHLGGSHDMAMPGGGSDGGGMLPDIGLNACGDNSPSCANPCLGPTCMPPTMFPLPSDMPPNPNVGSDGVGRQPGTGWIVLNTQNASFNYIWIADDQDYYVGMVSKVDTRSKAGTAGGAVNTNYREVARYLTVTCDSNESTSWLPHDTFKIGQNAAGGPTQHGTDCDGTKGCCARAAAGARTPVQLYHNRPSRTAVDFNGDAWIANRAHVSYGPGGCTNNCADPWDAQIEHQSSVSKIANDPSECIDRNNNGKIETSFDANNDGIIQTDCNGNGIPDSIADVTAAPCIGGALQEFWGLDDECILFTTNTGAAGGVGRPLALGPGANDFAPSDAWAGRFNDGIFYRINGSTGLASAPVQVQKDAADNIDSHPYGAAIDQSGILWAPNLDNAVVFYFDTKNTANQGYAKPPAAFTGAGSQVWDGAFYGIALDGYTVTPAGGMPTLVQQVWLAHWAGSIGPGVWRYTPNRATGFAGLNQGTWTLFTFTAGGGMTPNGSGRGVGVDNRQPQSFAWVGIDGSSGVGRVPIDLMPNTDPTKTLEVSIPAAANTSYLQTTRSGTLGTGVAADLDVWAINQNDSTATHFKIDGTGAQTGIDQVDLNDNAHLPTGATKTHQPPVPYTYSDFTGFGLRNFTNPHGFYSYIYSGCGPMKTKWLKIVWDADVPTGTALQVKARSAEDPTALMSAPYTAPYTMSPADLATAPGPVMPNPSGYLQVEFDLSTTSKSLTPALKSFTVLYECVGGIT